MIFFGWIFSIGGGIGLIYTTSLRDTTEYKWNSAFGRDTSEVDMLYYLSMAALILGIIFLIVGYLKQKNSNNHQNSDSSLQHSSKSISINYDNPSDEKINQNISKPVMKEEALFCRNCGNAFDTNDIFCSKCGIKKYI